MRISDWSSDVCSSDLHVAWCISPVAHPVFVCRYVLLADPFCQNRRVKTSCKEATSIAVARRVGDRTLITKNEAFLPRRIDFGGQFVGRSEEHTSELQSLMRNSSAVFCLIKKSKITIFCLS